MKEIILIIKKELTELLRDKKTIINSIILPTLLTPILIIGIAQLTKFISEKDSQKTIKIGLLNAPEEFQQLLAADTLNKITSYTEAQNFTALIKDETIQTALVFPKDWNADMERMATSELQIYRNEAKRAVNQRVGNYVTAYGEMLKGKRISNLQIPIEKLNPFTSNFVEVGEKKEAIGKQVGGFVPYLFILTLWGGCLLACIDLVTGEKERRTIETTLALPISKFKVLLGKSFVASLLGFFPAVFNIIGLVIGIKLISDIPPEIVEFINELLSFQSVVMILLLLFPFALFLSGTLIALISSATTFKEAQSKATPIIMVLILPLALALLPGVELTWATVFVPVLNIGLGIKEITAGTMDFTQYLAILFSLIALAVGAIYLSYKRFSDENAILK